MTVLKNPRHEAFIQAVANGESRHNAYVSVYKRSKNWNKQSIDTAAYRLFMRDDVTRRYRELLQQVNDIQVLDRKRKMILLTDIATDPKQRATDRIKAIDTLNKMTGEYIQKIELSGMQEAQTKLEELLQQRRERRKHVNRIK